MKGGIWTFILVQRRKSPSVDTRVSVTRTLYGAVLACGHDHRLVFKVLFHKGVCIRLLLFLSSAILFHLLWLKANGGKVDGKIQSPFRHVRIFKNDRLTNEEVARCDLIKH